MVRCGTCGGDNREEARFCATCGAGLAVPCPGCGAVPARPGARFCDACGTELGAAPAPGDQARKVVTILFADLVGSTSAQEGADPEAVRRWVDRYYAVLRREVEAHGGRVAKFTGDGVMAVFGIPEVREDDARRAIEAAAALHDAMPELDSGAGAPPHVALRVGVNTGEVVVSPVDDDVVGDAVNVAARLQTAAGAGQVLVGESTFRLVRLGALLRAVPPLDLKGKSAPVNAFLLVSLTRGEEGPTSPFVGRAGELERLLAVLDDSIAARRARLATIVGSPGVGKSRLARELAVRAGHRARVVDVRCEAVGGSTFAPIAAALRQAASLDDDADAETVLAALTALFDEDEADRHRVAAGVASLLGVGEPGLPEEVFWSVRRLIENAGQRGPIVFVFDDMHWAEPLLLDLIENVAEWTRGAPVMVLVTARPELRELRPSLVEAGGRVQAVINLEGLEVDESRRLTRELAGGVDLPDALLERVASASEGNPLFVGELVRMLVDDGVLELVDGAGRVTVDVAELEVPVTIHALLGARLDRLGPGERAVLEAASVLGKTFYRGVLAALVPSDLVPHLDEHLEGLRRKELVEPAGTYWLDEPVLRFHHVLIRDAAYRRLLKETRAALHEQAAHWLEVKVGDLHEHDDVIGYQLEQAHLLRLEAGDEREGLGRQAADRLAAAGRRSLEADDRPAAASLLGRALVCLPVDSEERGELLIERCEALLAMGDATEAAGAVAELLDVSSGSPRLEAWASCFTGELANLADAGALAATAERAERAATLLAGLGDAAGEAKAHAVRAASLARLGRIAECEASLDRALAAARRAGDRRRATAILAGAPVAALWGPNPVTRASGRCLDVVRVLRITSRAPAVEATSLRCQAVLEALRGRDDAARRMLASARRSLEDLGHEHGLLQLDLAAGMAELLADRPADAERMLRRAHEGFHALGADVDAGLAAALLARVRLGAGDVDDAIDLTEESEKLGGDDLKAGIAWRSVRAEALVHRGDLEAARRLAGQAVALAEPTDALLDHADALMAQAEVLRASGEAAAAAGRARTALELYERKEASVPATRARAFLGEELPAPQAEPEPAGGAEHPTIGAFTSFWAMALAGRWEEVEAGLAEDALSEDRRPIVGLGAAVGREAWMAAARSVIGIGARDLAMTLVADRDERLALVRSRVGGPISDDELLHVLELDQHGRFVANVAFAPEDLADAITELDRRAVALSEEAPRTAAPTENAASMAWRHMIEVCADGRWDEWRAGCHPEAREVDHRRLTGGDVVYDLDEIQASIAGILEGGMHSVQSHLLDSRGDRLALLHVHWEIGHAVARADADTLHLIEVDEDGLYLQSDIFELDHLDDARAELHRRASEDERRPPLTNQAAQLIQVGFDLCVQGAWDELAELLDDAVQSSDHRPIVGGGIRHAGVAAFVENVRTVPAMGVSEITSSAVAIRGAGLALVRVRYSGDVGAGELETLQLVEVTDRGRITRNDVYELDQLMVATEALDQLYLARLDPELAALLDAAIPLLDLLMAHDWDGVAALLPESFRGVDHRPMGWGDVDRSGFLDIYRTATAVAPDAEFFTRAYHGISRHGFCATSVQRGRTIDGTEFETQNVAVIEVRDGAVVRLECFAPEDVAQGMAHLRALGRTTPLPENAATRFWDRWLPHLLAADWEGVAAVMAHDVIGLDSRPLFGETDPLLGRDAVIEGNRGVLAVGVSSLEPTLVELGGDRWALAVVRYAGALGSTEVLQLFGVTEDGRLRHSEVFELTQQEEALTRLRRLAGESQAVPPNAAARFFADCFALGQAGRWDEFASKYRPDARHRDHRPIVGGVEFVGREACVTHTQSVFRAGVTAVSFDVVAVAGDRIAVVHSVYTGAQGSVELLELVTLDAEGRAEQSHVYEPDQLAEAAATLRQLWVSSLDPVEQVWAAPVQRAFECASTGDIDGLRGCLAEDFVLDDHRELSFGTLDKATWLAVLGDLFEEAPDAFIQMIQMVALGEHGVTTVLEIRGNRDGGLFSTHMLVVMERRGDLVTRMDLYPPEDLAAAAARFDQLHVERGVGARVGWLFARAVELAGAGDWDGYRELIHPNAVLEDRRAVVGGLPQGTLAEIIGFAQSVAAVGFTDVRTTTVASRGDRLGLFQVEFSGSGVEVQMLQVIELDDERRFQTCLAYDLDQLDEALSELEARFLAGEGAQMGEVWRAAVRLEMAMNSHDLAAIEDVFHPDLVQIDHRPVGWGQLDRAGYLELLAPLLESAPDARWVMVRDLWATPTVGCAQVQVRGSTEEGGSFVMDFVNVGTVRDGRIATIEIYALDALADVHARFLALAAVLTDADAPSGPRLENLASRVVRAGNDLGLQGAWDVLAAGLHPEVVLTDRRPLVGGMALEGPEAYLQFVRSVFSTGVDHVAIEVRAQRGDRLALVDVVHSGPGASIETLQVAEGDEVGRHLLRHDIFDVDQLGEALAELDSRYAAGEGAAVAAGWTPIVDMFAAATARDLPAIEALLHPDFVAMDHRSISFGRLERDDYPGYFPPMWEESPDARWTVVRDLATCPRGALVEVELTGTHAGGPLVRTSLLVMEAEDGLVLQLDAFEAEDLVAAEARFAELAGESG